MLQDWNAGKPILLPKVGPLPGYRGRARLSIDLTGSAKHSSSRYPLNRIRINSAVWTL
jgi:hypothetical protein